MSQKISQLLDLRYFKVFFIRYFLSIGSGFFLYLKANHQCRYCALSELACPQTEFSVDNFA